jgi:hypothetical protein
MHFDLDEEELIQDQYFAMAAADALRRITEQRGNALFLLFVSITRRILLI